MEYSISVSCYRIFEGSFSTFTKGIFDNFTFILLYSRQLYCSTYYLSIYRIDRYNSQCSTTQLPNRANDRSVSLTREHLITSPANEAMSSGLQSSFEHAGSWSPHVAITSPTNQAYLFDAMTFLTHRSLYLSRCALDMNPYIKVKETIDEINIRKEGDKYSERYIYILFVMIDWLINLK